LVSFGLVAMGRIDQAWTPLVWADVHSPAGLTRVPGRAAGRQIQEMISTVGQRVPQGEALLVYGWPTWGFAMLHPCPVRWDGFAPPDFPPGAYTHDAIAEVEAKRVAWIVTPVFEPPSEDHPDEWRDLAGGISSRANRLGGWNDRVADRVIEVERRALLRVRRSNVRPRASRSSSSRWPRCSSA
jgi:hypothetical protein